MLDKSYWIAPQTDMGDIVPEFVKTFENSLIYTTVLSEIYKTQLNPTISYLHEPGVRRFSLSLDIAEIFKPLLGDRLIFSMLNRGQITKKGFRFSAMM